MAPTTPISGATIIAIVGVTGSGKSRFIKKITQRKDIKVGEGLCSETDEVIAYPLSLGGHEFILIDTPGFDDTDRDEEDIYLSIASWLEKSYRKGQRLTGMIYLHRIIDTREKGSEIRNLKMFQKLCGKDNFKNVILGITFWDQEDPGVAAARQKELTETPDFWGDMILEGSRVERIPETREDCIKLIAGFAWRTPITLCIQDETVHKGIPIGNTSAASTLPFYDAIQENRRAEEAEKAAAREKYNEKMKMNKIKLEQEAKQRWRDFKRLQYQQRLEEEALVKRKKDQEEIDRKAEEAKQQEQRDFEKNQAELEALSKRLLDLRVEEEEKEVQRLETLRRERDRRRAQAHSKSLRSQFDLLQRAVRNGSSRQKVACSLYCPPGTSRRIVVALSFCDLCMKHGAVNVPLWICNACTAPSFAICEDCYRAKNRCFSGHPYTMLVEHTPRNTLLSNWKCRRWSPGPSSRMVCSKCSVQPESLFLHCCDCDNDNFDLCIHCWATEGRTCHRPSHHNLRLFGWYPPLERLA